MNAALKFQSCSHILSAQKWCETYRLLIWQPFFLRHYPALSQPENDSSDFALARLLSGQVGTPR
jgi:hypothetical protein